MTSTVVRVQVPPRVLNNEKRIIRFAFFIKMNFNLKKIGKHVPIKYRDDINSRAGSSPAPGTKKANREVRFFVSGILE